MLQDKFIRLFITELDARIHREILRLRARHQLTQDEFRGLYLSDQLVDSLLQENKNTEIDFTELTHRINEITQKRLNEYCGERLEHVFSSFRMGAGEQLLFLCAFILELDSKYETLTAYLHNDVTRKKMSLDLVMRLFSGESHGFWRHAMHRLILSKLIRLEKQSNYGSLLSEAFLLHPDVILFLVVPPGKSSAPVIPEIQKKYFHDHTEYQSLSFNPVNGFNIVDGDEASSAINQWCANNHIPIDRWDLHKFMQSWSNAFLRASLWKASLSIECYPDISEKDNRELFSLFHSVPFPLYNPVFIHGTRFQNFFPENWHRISLLPPSHRERKKIWMMACAEYNVPCEESTCELLADHYSFSGTKIDRIVRIASLHYKPDDNNPERLINAAREHSYVSPGNGAQRIHPAQSLDMLVLPDQTMKEILTIASAMKMRKRVYEDWGFKERLDYGGGIKALFSGAPGTGKTMAATAIAHYLGIDLLRIDLSGIMSKYIGETEKNLARIFDTARQSNSLLFFDEADALFGKRSEIKDAHDRYANIETAYLLQKIDEYDDIVILATNIGKNIDQAFSRRLHYSVKFPLPGKDERYHIWKGMIPLKTPVSSDIDFDFLSNQFNLTGGDIKNIVINAAFQAAADNTSLGMNHIIHSVSRQYHKQGKIPSHIDFKQYMTFVA